MSNENCIDQDFDPIFNQQLIDEIVTSGSGQLTKLSAAADTIIKIQIREDSFFRKILPPRTITNSELDRSPDHDRPFRIEELESAHKGAVSVPFNVSGNTEFFRGPKGVIEFFQIKTPKFTKNINELRTYRHDIRKLIMDNALKDIQTKEDGLFISLVDQIVGAVNGVGAAGVQQHFKAGDGTGNTSPELQGGLNRKTHIEMQKILERRRLNNGVFLMNRSTAKEFVKSDRAEIGGDLSEKMWKDGLKAIGDSVILGVPHIFTIKDDLVPDNIVYSFAEPDFLGRFYILQDVTMYVEKKEDIITMNATETIGAGILNVAGVAKIDLNDET